MGGRVYHGSDFLDSSLLLAAAATAETAAAEDEHEDVGQHNRATHSDYSHPANVATRTGSVGVEKAVVHCDAVRSEIGSQLTASS